MRQSYSTLFVFARKISHVAGYFPGELEQRQCGSNTPDLTPLIPFPKWEGGTSKKIDSPVGKR